MKRKFSSWYMKIFPVGKSGSLPLLLFANFLSIFDLVGCEAIFIFSACSVLTKFSSDFKQFSSSENTWWWKFFVWKTHNIFTSRIRTVVWKCDHLAHTDEKCLNVKVWKKIHSKQLVKVFQSYYFCYFVQTSKNFFKNKKIKISSIYRLFDFTVGNFIIEKGYSMECDRVKPWGSSEFRNCHLY